MNGENLIDWECGFYDQFEQELREGEITTADIDRLYKDKKITKYQYEYGINYMKED